MIYSDSSCRCRQGFFYDSVLLSSLAVLLASRVIFWINNIHSIVQNTKKIDSHAFIEGGNI